MKRSKNLNKFKKVISSLIICCIKSPHSDILLLFNWLKRSKKIKVIKIIQMMTTWHLSWIIMSLTLIIDIEVWKIIPFGMAKWFGRDFHFGGLKFKTDKSNRFAFWVELVAPDCLVWITAHVWFASYCIKAGSYHVHTQRIATIGFLCLQKKWKMMGWVWA